jgi:hypothetical protein
MIALEIAISKVFIDVATSAAIDVITKRSINPVIRGAGGAYKVYSLTNPAIGIHNCLRISAYSDALGILAHEVVVTVASKELANALVQINGANFEVHREAEQYLLEPEFWLFGNCRGIGCKTSCLSR